MTKNDTRVPDTEITCTKYTLPTPLQDKAFDLLGVSYRLVASRSYLADPRTIVLLRDIS